MPELAADAAGLLRRARARQRARLRRLDGRHGRPGAGDPLPGARARARAGRRRRRAARGPCCRRRRSSRRSAGRSRASARSRCAVLARVPARASRAGARAAARTSGATARPPAAPWAHWWATVYHDTVSRLGGIQAPTLVLHGGATRLAPVANARLLAERIPDAELTSSAGRGARLRARAARASPTPRSRTGSIAGVRSPRGVPAPASSRRAEPLTRAFGLPIGAARTGASLAGLATDRIKRSAHVAIDR